MLAIRLNGQAHRFADGISILEACRSVHIEIPTLCHDDRLQPSGACRLCVVAIKGWDRFAPACRTVLSDGMEIATHSPAVEEARRTLLELLARDYPAEAVEQCPGKPFHHWLRHYQVRALGGLPPHSESVNRMSDCSSSFLAQERPEFRDATHPYVRADFEQCIHCFRCVRICDEVQGQFVWRAWHRGNATRIRPGQAASLLASECVSCGACADTCPTGALEDQSVLRHGPPVQWTRTTCPYCGVGCEMNVGTREGLIVQAKPVIESAVSKGHLCVKGRYAFEFVHSGDRILTPMVRAVARREAKEGQGTGVAGTRHPAGLSPAAGWEAISWTEAISCVAENLTRILEESGPDSIGVLGSARGTNEENYLAQKFARVVLGTNNVDCCARVCHAPSAAGMQQTLGTGAATNSFDDIERAATVMLCGCNPTENHPIVGARIRQAVLRGARLIVIDPREIELVRDAALHLPLRPGTNIPLLHALAHVIIRDGLTDVAAVRARVGEFEEFQKFIAAWTPERAAAITGVRPELIRQAAHLYATARPSICFHGLGATEHVQGSESVMALVNLALLTGNFGQAGTGVNPLRGQNNVQGSSHMGCEPGHLTGYVALEEGRAAFEQIWQAPVPHGPGLNLMQMLDAAEAGKLKALWAIGYDVAFTNPNAAVTQRALSRLEFVVVQDLFANELAREFGHVFLPACSSFEKEGTFMNSERRIQRVRAALVPLGQSRPDWQILCDVARAMGFGEQFAFQSPEDIWEEVRAVWKAGAGIRYDRLETNGLQWPCPSESHPGTPILHVTSFPHGGPALLKRIEYVATTETATEEYPFLLTTGRTLYQFNAGTMTQRTPNAVLREADTLDMALSDAKKLGLEDGEEVRVRSRHGEARLRLRWDSRVKPGELFATFHAAEVFLNHLTGPHRDRLTMTPEYKVVAVRVEKG